MQSERFVASVNMPRQRRFWSTTMLKMNHGLARWPLCCAVALTLFGCAMLTPEWHPHRASASACPDSSMEMCVIDNYGKRCGCASAATTDAMKRGSR